jgi:bifunctional non-homologous end joining protein LigD
VEEGMGEVLAAKEGLERWKARHPKVAELLTVEDVLVDRMRGTSSTWTRIRVNLRNVPEELRPPQEAPDPDDVPESQRSPGRRPKKASGSSPETTTDE